MYSESRDLSSCAALTRIYKNRKVKASTILIVRKTLVATVCLVLRYVQVYFKDGFESTCLVAIV
jgi:hypothetical protein